MYHQYFGLDEPAFSIAVNPKYLYMSSQHKEALAHLVYGVQGGGFVLLSGEVGTGKTTIVRCLLEQMPGDTEIAFVLNPMADVTALLATICNELHIQLSAEDHSIKIMMDKLQSYLIENHAEGKRTVLLIDEAQLLSADVLEQIRLLTNLETSTDKLMQIVLVGQPEVNELLAQPRLRQLSQRITARFHLEALSLEETKQYIEHRLSVAGKKEGRVIFSDNIIKKIHRFSGGIPRLINILCERLLVGAYGHNKYEIDTETFKRALSEVEGARPREAVQPASQYWPKLAIAASVLCAVLIAVILLWPTTPAESELNQEPTFESEPSVVPAASTANNESRRTLKDIPEKTSQQAGAVLEQASKQHLNQLPALNQQAKPIRSTRSTRKIGEIANVTSKSNPVIDSSVTPNTYYFNAVDAFSNVFKYYGVDVDMQSHPCWQTEQHLLSCAKTHFESWSEIEALNRPVILSLITPSKDLNFSVLVGLNDDSAFVIDQSDHVIEVSKADLGRAWNGSVTYLWRKPEGFDKSLSVGMSSPVVAWVAEQFALLDGQDYAITGQRFTTRLQARIKIFQASSGLDADGILGERTIMELNEAVGRSMPLIRTLPTE